MLEDFVKARRPEDEELAAGIKAAREALNACQMKIKEAGLPVMVIFEGWGAAGKGSVLGRVIKSIDPRFFKVQTYAAPTAEEKRYPFLYRYIRDIPEKGKFTFYDTYWMEEITDARLDGSMSDAEYEERIDSINRTERTLVDNGYLGMKFFFQIGKKEQKRRLDELLDNKDTKWRVDKSDLYENKHYDESIKVYDKYLKDTNSPTAPWYIIDAKDKKFAVPILQNTYKLKRTPKLKDIELKGKTLTDEEYDKRLDELQSELRQLHYKLYRKKIPVIIAYEGWDAAGKGGNIKRITGALDPRGFEVLPIASPEPHEKARHFLWRFWTRLPKTGHIAIFDRTWYGRVMVERIEGFCSENDWQRAYNEINEFEKELTDWGAVVIKFWVQIDKRTQLKRFKERQATPEKQWKITDEDWRNREKWNQYESAIDEMIQKTSTEFAPWYILESVDKKYARIKALEIVIERLEKACRKQ